MAKNIKINPLQQRAPFGGHHFHENHEGEKVTIKSGTFQGVVKLLTEHRVRNGYPLGNPKEEVTRYYAENWPWMVAVDESPNEVARENKAYLFWRDWIQSIWKKPDPKMIHRREAAERWVICEKCEFCKSQEWPDTKESSETDKRAFLYRKGEWSPKKLKFCSLHRADIGTLSFLQDAKSFSNKPEDKPDKEDCWVK